jgi:hypothetical protein
MIFIGRDDGIPTPVIHEAFNGGTTDTFLVPPTRYGFEDVATPARQLAEPTATEATPVPQDRALPVQPEGIQPPASPPRPPQPQ